ncbi:unnamed protein product, partial [Adineta steineri]
MILIEYSGDIHIVLRTYLGLNQRLNNILLDYRSHLLTRCLQLTVGNEDLNSIYDSSTYQDLIVNLSSIKKTENEKQVIEYLQMFITVHFKKNYFQLDNEFQSRMDTFVTKQHEHTSAETNELRYQLQNELQKLKESHNVDIQNIARITSLIRTHGIDLQDDVTARQSIFSIDPFIFKFISCHLFTLKNSQLFRHHVTELYKALVICDGYHLKCQSSNPYTRNIISHGFVYVINEL